MHSTSRARASSRPRHGDATMSDKTTVVSVPHAKAAKPGPWCNTTPTLLQRAKHRRHSLGDLRHELLAPRSVAKLVVAWRTCPARSSFPKAVSQFRYRYIYIYVCIYIYMCVYIYIYIYIFSSSSHILLPFTIFFCHHHLICLFLP